MKIERAPEATPGGLFGRVVSFSLRFHGVVLGLAFLLTAYGAYSLTQAKYDVYPEFAPPQAVIQTEAPGLAPEQVEVLVTQPIENAVNGVPRVESLRSSSIQGLSLITITFFADSDIYLARQQVAERLAAIVAELPREVEAPEITPLTTSSGQCLVVGLTSGKLSLMDLRTIADWTIKPQLLAVPGVAKITVFGGEVKQLQVQVKPDRLIKYGLSLQEVLEAAGDATAVRGAGFIDNANQRLVLDSRGQSITPAELGRTVVIAKPGAVVTLSDVADVVEAPEPPFGAASIMGRPGVELMVSAQYGANTLEVSGKVEQALAELMPSLEAQGVTVIPDLFRPAGFIERAVSNVRTSLLIGAVLVIAVLFLFLFNLRTAAISCTAIPLSLLAAVTVLGKYGFTLNTMTLGGLAIAVGEVVDDAVIDVENIYRRLRENAKAGAPRSAFSVVLHASLEVRSAVIFATLAVIVVFLPILTMSGVAGRLFAPLGLAYIFAVLASLAVALTLTPLLCLLLLTGRQLLEQEPHVVKWLKAGYDRILRRADRRLAPVIVAVAVLVMAGLSAIPFMSGEFLPELREGHFIAHVSSLPGASLEESLRIGRQVTDELLMLPYVRAVAQRVGRAEKADDVYGTYYSEMDVDLKPLNKADSEAAPAEIRQALARVPGVNGSIMTFLSERVMETISGYVAPVVVNIFGPDLDALDQKAAEVAAILEKVPGASGVTVQSPPGVPEMAIKLRPDDLQRWGFAPREVLDAVKTAYQGDVVGQVYDANRVFGVSVILHPSSRRSVADVGSLPLASPLGSYVPLSGLADIFATSGRYAVLHQGARRVQTITCDVAGASLDRFVAEAKKRIGAQVALPPGVYLEFTGAGEAQARSRRDLLAHSLMAGIGVILLLLIVTRSFRNLALIMLNLPFALVGGVLAALASGSTLSIGATVGFVTLFGVTLRNSIMMISHYEHLLEAEGLSWGLETAIRGASERLAPILMTALVTAMGLLPLAVASGTPGREIEGPMAIVILGGLLTSTALNLLVLPLLARRYGRFQEANEQ